MHGCVEVFGQIMGYSWESGSDMKGKGKYGDFTWFHLLLLTPATSLLPGELISGERLRLVSHVSGGWSLR